MNEILSFYDPEAQARATRERIAAAAQENRTLLEKYIAEERQRLAGIKQQQEKIMERAGAAGIVGSQAALDEAHRQVEELELVATRTATELERLEQVLASLGSKPPTEKQSSPEVENVA